MVFEFGIGEHVIAKNNFALNIVNHLGNKWNVSNPICFIADSLKSRRVPNNCVHIILCDAQVK